MTSRSTRSSLLRLIAWVDANCPYLGEEEIRAMADPEFPASTSCLSGHG